MVEVKRELTACEVAEEIINLKLADPNVEQDLGKKIHQWMVMSSKSTPALVMVSMLAEIFNLITNDDLRSFAIFNGFGIAKQNSLMRIHYDFTGKCCSVEIYTQ